MQSGVTVNNTTRKITGTLNYMTDGQLVTDWGEGHFLCLTWTNIDAHADELWVGLNPSVSSGLQECIDDPNPGVAAKITDPAKQKFIVLQKGDGYGSNRQVYDISGLVLAPRQ